MPQNNANEGAQFTPQNIATTSDFLAYIERYFSGFSADDIAMVQEMYPSNTMTNPNAIKFSTLENTGPSALEISPFANGQQQRAYVSSSNLINGCWRRHVGKFAKNLQADVTFVCPSYWLAEALPEAWHYQFSVPPANHAFDLGLDFAGTTHPAFSNDFVMAY
jgi:hypothetical protein